MCVCFVAQSLSDSLQSHGMKPARLLCSQVFSRQVYWSGLPCPPPGDLPWVQGLNPGFLHCRQILYRLSHQGSPKIIIFHFKSHTSFFVFCFLFFFNISEATRFMCIERPILLFAATWMELEGILLRQKSQRGKDKHCVIPHKCGI